MKNGNSICLRTVDPAYRPMERALLRYRLRRLRSLASPLAWCARTGFSSLPALACHRGVVGSFAHPGGPSHLQCAIRGEEIVEPGAVLVQWHNASLHQVCTMVGPHDLLTPRDVLAAAVMHLSGGPVCACVRREVLRTFGPAFVAG